MTESLLKYWLRTEWGQEVEGVIKDLSPNVFCVLVMSVHIDWCWANTVVQHIWWEFCGMPICWTGVKILDDPRLNEGPVIRGWWRGVQLGEGWWCWWWGRSYNGRGWNRWSDGNYPLHNHRSPPGIKSTFLLGRWLINKPLVRNTSVRKISTFS